MPEEKVVLYMLKEYKQAIDKCLFYNNSANSGGAIYVVAGYYYKTYISNSTFLLNKAHNNGGALYCTNNINILIQYGWRFHIQLCK